LSILVNITSPGTTVGLEDARASIFSVIVIPKLDSHYVCKTSLCDDRLKLCELREKQVYDEM
jgi:hypothetical protein